MKRFVLTCLMMLALCSTAFAQTITQLTMESDSLDHLGAGKTFVYDGAAEWQVDQYGSGLQIIVHPYDYSTHWLFLIRPPQGQNLLPGQYATKRTPDTNLGGLDVTSNFAGCNSATGSMIVRHIAFDGNGDLSEAWLTFEQHCEGRDPELRGEIMYNVPYGIVTPTKQHSWGSLKTMYR
jgi:hypothetical protein